MSKVTSFLPSIIYLILPVVGVITAHYPIFTHNKMVYFPVVGVITAHYPDLPSQ
jgi:hypothetical protein